jgi:hypothetical protein
MKRRSGLLTEQNVNDIEREIIKKIIRDDSMVSLIDSSCTIVDDKTTFVSVSYLKKGGDVVTKHGIAKKRKGDVYNEKTGQLIALIDIL